MKLSYIVPLVIGGVLMTSVAGAQLLRSGYDEPTHEVVFKDDRFEVRQYGVRVIAETLVTSDDWRKGTSTGFGRLAEFIFGGNKTTTGESSKIAMTTPVESQPTGEGYVVVFTMPADYTVDTLPRPVDQRVTVREIPATTTAALRFSGNARRADIAGLTVELLQRVRDGGFQPTSTVKIAQYDPPWIPGLMRRNELMVDVAPIQK